jgi:hypothetical protein
LDQGQVRRGRDRARLLAQQNRRELRCPGSDEATEVSGDGDADLAEHATLTGEFTSIMATTCHSSTGAGEYQQPAWPANSFEAPIAA